MNKNRKKVKDAVSSAVTAAGGSLAGGVAAGEAVGKTLEKKEEKKPSTSKPSKPKSFDADGIIEYDRERVKEGRKNLKKMQKTFKKD